MGGPDAGADPVIDASIHATIRIAGGGTSEGYGLRLPLHFLHWPRYCRPSFLGAAGLANDVQLNMCASRTVCPGKKPQLYNGPQARWGRLGVVAVTRARGNTNM